MESDNDLRPYNLHILEIRKEEEIPWSQLQVLCYTLDHLTTYIMFPSKSEGAEIKLET